MIAPTRCTSRLGPAIERYVTLKQALGRQYAAERWMLGHVDRFLTGRDADLTADTFAAWCLTLQHLTTGTRRRRMQVVRNACLYRRRQEPTCFVPDDRLFPPTHHAIRPYLFTDEDIRRLLTAASALRPSLTSPLRRDNVRLAIVLLYTTGVRRGELVSLRLSDYDADQRTLLIRESKFHKSRVVPLSRDGAGEIDRLLEHRRTQRLPLTPDSHLLWNRSRGGNAYTGAGLHHVLHALFRSTQIRTEHGRVPRVHDFRHAFAITALLRWYRAGVDVQAKLPLLATYMGHVSIVSTAYYLQFVEPLAAAASERFAGHCGALVTTRLAHGDAR